MTTMECLHSQVVDLTVEIARRRRRFEEKKTYSTAAMLQATERERDTKIGLLRSSFQVIEGGKG